MRNIGTLRRVSHYRLKDKVAVVTGGACGIGEGTVRRFVEEGASVVVADLQAEVGEALAIELGARARFILTDITRGEVDAGQTTGAVQSMYQMMEVGIIRETGPRDL